LEEFQAGGVHVFGNGYPVKFQGLVVGIEDPVSWIFRLDAPYGRSLPDGNVRDVDFVESEPEDAELPRLEFFRPGRYDHEGDALPTPVLQEFPDSRIPGKIRFEMPVESGFKTVRPFGIVREEATGIPAEAQPRGTSDIFPKFPFRRFPRYPERFGDIVKPPVTAPETS
jgi:hypothetical protein